MYIFFIQQVTPRCAPNCSCIDAYVVVYCIDDRSSFDRAVDILYNLRKEEHNDSAIILVANKCELARSRLITMEGKYFNFGAEPRIFFLVDDKILIEKVRCEYQFLYMQSNVCKDFKKKI